MVEEKPYSYPLDIWQLGVTLFWIIALKHPFRPLNVAHESLFGKKLRSNILKGQYHEIPS